MTKQQNNCILIFPGQGMPFVGMGKHAYNESIKIKEVWDCASEISGFDVYNLCMKGPMNKLVKTRYQQVAVTATNIATLLMLREKVQFNEVGFSGHSAGEYSALFASNVIDLESLFKLINFRSELMQGLSESKKGVMYVVKNKSNSEVVNLIDQQGFNGIIEICCDNSNNQQVIGGEILHMEKFINYLYKIKVESLRLNVNGAWHTRLMEDGKKTLEFYLNEFKFSAPEQKIIMNYSAKNAESSEEIKINLVKQLTETVRWRETIEEWVSQYCQNFMEVSCKKSLFYLAVDFPEIKSMIHSGQFIK
ncbi:ACP S-malonyltransferase [Morganella morganii]|nr:ACP S-malonyltransferase [Morganella morganii]